MRSRGGTREPSLHPDVGSAGGDKAWNIPSQLEESRKAPLSSPPTHEAASSPQDNAPSILWLPSKPCLQDATLLRAWAT